MPDTEIIIEIIGEGKTDRGVLSSLVHSLCDLHPAMRVRGLPMPFAQSGGFDRKVEIAKRNAMYRAGGPPDGLVFVVDTEGEHRKAFKEVTEGRDRRGELPTAVGVAHPCIESWLLADATAIRKALKLSVDPIVPEHPESLPAPCKDLARSPKMVLAACAGKSKELTVREKASIAKQMRDMVLVGTRCPKSFAPFADEVIKHIKPLFPAANV